jgi:hypothetical protein
MHPSYLGTADTKGSSILPAPEMNRSRWGEGSAADGMKKRLWHKTQIRKIRGNWDRRDKRREALGNLTSASSTALT